MGVSKEMVMERAFTLERIANKLAFGRREGYYMNYRSSYNIQSI